MQTSSTVPAAAPPAVPGGVRRRGQGLAVATAALAFASAAFCVAAFFPRWDTSSSLHDTFANIVNNLLWVAVLVVAGVFLLVSRSSWVRVAAALLVVGCVVGYLPGIGTNVGVGINDGGVAAGFWLGQVSNVLGLAAAVMGLVYAFGSGVWSWRPDGSVTSPVLTGAVGFLGLLLVFAWTLSATRVFDSSNALVNEQFGPLDSRLAETSGFVVGAGMLLLALLLVVCTRPSPLSGFLLIGLMVSGFGDIFGFDRWGFDAAQGGTVGPGPGALCGYLATLGLIFVGVAWATAKERADEPAGVPPAPSREALALVAQLDDLYAKGFLSEEEYAAKRARALGSDGTAGR